MATYALASAVFEVPIEELWCHLRDFSFPAKLLPSVIDKVELEGVNVTGSTVGVVRKMIWKNGEIARHHLLALSDQHFYAVWELVESQPPSEVSAVISQIKCYRISENNQTLVEWSSEYSADAPSDLPSFDQKAFQNNLAEIRTILTGKPLPILYHLSEGPSTRVLWLSYELGIPMSVIDHHPNLIDLQQSGETERSLGKGGVVTTYVEGDLELLESGAILMHLLETRDIRGILIPKIGTLERSIFHKYFFYSSSTADHLLFQSYKLVFVSDEGELGLLKIAKNKRQWDEEISQEFEKQLKHYRYLCGNKFSAADIMVGWTLYIANLLGWLNEHIILKDYFEMLLKRPAFQKALYSK